jgi:hypothetical protein
MKIFGLCCAFIMMTLNVHGSDHEDGEIWNAIPLGDGKNDDWMNTGNKNATNKDTSNNDQTQTSIKEIDVTFSCCNIL